MLCEGYLGAWRTRQRGVKETGCLPLEMPPWLYTRGGLPVVADYGNWFKLEVQPRLLASEV